MSMPLISIIMPAYNSEKHIKDSIKSAINQTYKNWELLVINDNSKDKTAKIIQDFSDKDNRIKIINNQINLGVSKSRNKGIKLAKADWVAFLDSDDLWQKNKLAKQISFAQKNKVEFIFTGSSYINKNNKEFKGIFEVPREVSYSSLKKHNVISCSSVLVKRKYFKDIKMPDDNMHEDFATWLKILRLGIKAYGINEPLLIYRLYSGSKSGNKLKSFKMSYSVFRYLGLNRIESIHYTMSHLLNSIKKYKKIEG